MGTQPRSRRAAAAWTLTAAVAATAATPFAYSASPRYEAPIEEVVVTARKRAEPLRAVPASVTVLDADTLATLGARRLDDLTLRLPNLASDRSPLTGFSGRYVRGLNAGARNIGFDSGYAVFVDGVYAGRFAAANRVLQDVERVEYLPGPQGTLFGKNTTLGVVNVVTRRPAGPPRAGLDVGLGSDGYRRVQADAAAPLGGDWSVSGAVGRERRDGLVENVQLDTTGNDVDLWDGRLSLTGRTAGWDTTVALDYYRSTPDLIARQRLEGFGALPPREAGNDLPERLSDEDYGASVTLQRDFDLGALTAISAYRRFETAADVDDDAWNVPAQHLIDWTERTEQFSQELRFSADHGRWHHLAGAYFLTMTSDSSRTVASFFGQASADGALDARTWALFGTTGYDLTDDLVAEAGLRWTRESKDLDRYVQDGGGVLLDFDRRDDRSVTSVTPSASLRYAIDDHATAFVRYAQGFKSGGFNVDLVTAPAITPLEFDDERVDTVEAGVKSRWLDNRLRLDLTVFRSRYHDLQVSQYEVLPGATLPTLRITNAASAETTGLELGAELLLGAWRIAIDAGQTHSEVDDFPDPLGPGTGNWAGNGLGGPEWTTSLLVQHQRSLGRLGELTVTAEHLFQDALGGDLDGDALTRSDAIALTNLRAELVFGADRQWRLAAWVDNVFDTERVVERHRSAAPGLLMLIGFPPEIADSTVGLYNDPRTFGLELGLRL